MCDGDRLECGRYTCAAQQGGVPETLGQILEALTNLNQGWERDRQLLVESAGDLWSFNVQRNPQGASEFGGPWRPVCSTP
jgi:hypothetical protein